MEILFGLFFDSEALIFCIENKEFNANILIEIIKNKAVERRKEEQAEYFRQNLDSENNKLTNLSDSEAEKSNINQYEKMFEQCLN